MITEDKLLAKIEEINETIENPIDLSAIKLAIGFAKYYHHGQKRKSGEPFYTHPIEVAYMVADYLPDTKTLIVAILHDTIEDTKLTQQDIAKTFGEEIAQAVYYLTRIKEDGTKISSSEILEDLWLKHEHDLLLIKFFDRLHNINTIEAKKPEKIQKTVNETLKYFVALSEVLELHDVTDLLDQKLYEINLKYGFVPEPRFNFGSEFTLF